MEFLRKIGKNDPSYYWRCMANRAIYDRPFPCDKLANDRLRFKNCELYRADLFGHFGCVNAIEFSHDEQFIVSGGDDRRVLLWNVQKSLNRCEKETQMIREHSSNIFCLAFNNSDNKIYSSGNDRQILLHDIETGDAITIFGYDSSIYGISVDPCQDNVFTVATEDGRILMFDERSDHNSEPVIVLENRGTTFHAVRHHPVKSTLLAAGNSKDGCMIADIRGTEFALYRQFGNRSNCVSVTWNSTGKQIVALRRRKAPVLYELADTPKLIAVFNHEDYRNSCTMKSSSFCGLNDEYVMSGSDDFNIYLWKISDGIANGPDNETDAHLILKGHRSIPNQVRFSKKDCLIASSGVEKMIKIWSPMHLPYSSTISSFKQRRSYDFGDFVTPLSSFHERLNDHDYSDHSVTEDPKMIAFFDTLIERERMMRTDSESLSESDSSSIVSVGTVYEEEVQSDSASSVDDDSEQEHGNIGRSSPLWYALTSSSVEEEVEEEEREDPPRNMESQPVLEPLCSSTQQSEESRSKSGSPTSQSSESHTKQNRKRKWKKDCRRMIKRILQTTPSSDSEISETSSSSSNEDIDSGVSFSHSSSKVKFRRTTNANRSYRSRRPASNSDTD